MKKEQNQFISILLFLLMCFFSVIVNGQHIVINEILASNEAGIEDMDGNSSDWIELYNPSELPVSLLGYSITDDAGDSLKWIFPEVTLNSGEFLLLWASGKDRVDTTELHTNFKLDKDGECLALYEASGGLLDSLRFGEQQTDISYGRSPDGSIQWTFFKKSSPGESNRNGIVLIESPKFSHSQGYYDAPILLALSTQNPDLSIYYTTNGDIPTGESQHFDAPIAIDTTTVIRAASFNSQGISSLVVTQTYLIHENILLPVLSVVTDNANLYDEETGIWTHGEKTGDEWERPVSVTYFKKEEGEQFSLDAGIRIHGESTRGWNKRSFRLYFRSEYGQSELNYRIFASKNIDRFKRLVLRMGSQDHNLGSAYWTMLRCPLMQRLHSEVQPTVSTSRPFFLFLNGKLQGLYHFRERIDRLYLEENFGITGPDIIKTSWVWSGEIVEGDREHWEQTFMFFKMNDLGKPENMMIADQLINIKNFTDHYIFNIYGANWDWPQNNVRKFRNRENNGKWHWVMWDVDAVFGRSNSNARYPNWNGIEWATRDEVRTDLNSSDTPNLIWSTIMFRSLLRNSDYREYFMNRFADMMNSTLHYNHIIEVLDSLTAVIEPDYQIEAERWKVTKERWLENIERLKKYITNRRGYVYRHIREYFGVGNIADLTIDPQPINAGTVKVHTIVPAEFPWTGAYFKGLPFPVVAKPNPGYRFVRWEGDISDTSDSLMIKLNGDLTISPVFELDTAYDNIVINEINYNSAEDYDSEDWIELYNNSGHTVDLSGWKFKDSDDSHFFELPAGTTVMSGDFLVLVHDSAAFCSIFPMVENYIGNFDFGLSGGGDELRLFDSTGTIIDSLEYDDDDPWCPEADGTGATLELISPDLDNTQPENWEPSSFNGTPGLSNDADLEPVPVSLVYFQIKDATPEKVSLEWRTESEMNNLGFYIEKKSDDCGFQQIGFVKGHGTSAEPHTYQYSDEDIHFERCTYRLKQVDFDGSFQYSSEIEVNIEIPKSLMAHPCYPNPFNNSTMISFYNPAESHIKLSVFNIRGERIAILIDEVLQAGTHQVRWQGTEMNQATVPSGIYFVKIQRQHKSKIVKAVCIK